ncbi:MAG TPA: FAD-dependent oxidoreductase, partial [Acidimicrobiales bacterium]|nr:FAD-dependent oxidoreductase [Acidimicrobiales bacterium]
PHTAAAGLLPAGSVPLAPRLAELGVSPIIDVHVVYDRRVTNHALAASVGSPVQFVFDRTEAAGLDPAEGQVLAVSVSGADEEHGDRPEALIERYVAALSRLFPDARRATVLDAVVTREHEATFRGTPGTAGLRPGTSTRIANLFLAGAWTDTGWPATMEGAVRSGNRAAAWTLAHLAGLAPSAGGLLSAGVGTGGAGDSAGAPHPDTAGRFATATAQPDRPRAGAAHQHVELAATLGGSRR